MFALFIFFSYTLAAQDERRHTDTIEIRIRICKEIFVTRYRLVESDVRKAQPWIKDQVNEKKVTKPPIVKISGDVQYDFLYRSYLDIPTTQHDFRQHSLQASLHVKVNDLYPLTVSFSAQQNNSPFLRNLVNLNLQFDPASYITRAKGEFLEALKARYFAEPELRLTEAALQEELARYHAFNTRLAAPDLKQQLVAEKERLFDSFQKMKTLPADTSVSWRLTKTSPVATKRLPVDSFASYATKLQGERDSLQQRVLLFQRKRDSLRNLVEKDLRSVQQKVYKAKSYQELHVLALENDIALEKGAGLQRFISHVRGIGIGRSLINYSELTAWNVGLTGFNVEYNKKVYAAFVAGKLDFGFREFFGKQSGLANQPFFMGRIGLGQKERKAIIFSLFTGRKSNYGSLSPDTGSALFNVMGYAVEAILQKNEQTAIQVEVAKTTRPVTGLFSANNELKSLSDFKDWSNVGINVKGSTVLQSTATKISGFYRQTGANFQSFNVFIYRTQQAAWQLRVEQALANKRISIVGMLRKNDFTTPYTEKTFRTNTLFTTLQVSARFPKYPLLTVGYYPGSQVYMVDREHLRENVYYILNGSLVYPYRAGDLHLSSSVHFNRFSNKGTDSGFVVYSGTSYIASQTVTLRKLQYQGTYAYTAQEEMGFSTVESNVDYAPTKTIRLGAGIKYNRVRDGEVFWGSRFVLATTLKTLGRFQFQYEKTFVPTIYQSLFPVEVGRVTWLKHF